VETYLDIADQYEKWIAGFLDKMTADDDKVKLVEKLGHHTENARSVLLVHSQRLLPKLMESGKWEKTVLALLNVIGTLDQPAQANILEGNHKDVWCELCLPPLSLALRYHRPVFDKLLGLISSLPNAFKKSVLLTQFDWERTLLKRLAHRKRFSQIRTLLKLLDVMTSRERATYLGDHDKDPWFLDLVCSVGSCRKTTEALLDEVAKLDHRDQKLLLEEVDDKRWNVFMLLDQCQPGATAYLITKLTPRNQVRFSYYHRRGWQREFNQSYASVRNKSAYRLEILSFFNDQGRASLLPPLDDRKFVRVLLDHFKSGTSLDDQPCLFKKLQTHSVEAQIRFYENWRGKLDIDKHLTPLLAQYQDVMTQRSQDRLTKLGVSKDEKLAGVDAISKGIVQDNPMHALQQSRRTLRGLRQGRLGAIYNLFIKAYMQKRPRSIQTRRRAVDDAGQLGSINNDVCGFDHQPAPGPGL